MENLRPKTFPEDTLKATLNCYQFTSAESLSGPSGLPAILAQMWYKQNKELPPIQPQPLVQIPFLFPNDRTATRSETILAGEKIACFIVGGEKRLCLPQILTSVLREFSIAEINQACAELHIYCSRCLPEQLEILKALRILPINTAQCGLITKTDAERLVALLTDRLEPFKRDKLPKAVGAENGIPVYHECFGQGYGQLYLGAYLSPTSPCIMCKDCGYMYSTRQFIAHSDRSFEKRTCHWGFDPENWRNYLILPKNLKGLKREEYQKELDQVKSRFYGENYENMVQKHVEYITTNASSTKRKYESEKNSLGGKKIKEEKEKINDHMLTSHSYASIPIKDPAVARQSAFQPWSLRAATGIPVGQDDAHLTGIVPLASDRIFCQKSQDTPSLDDNGNSGKEEVQRKCFSEKSSVRLSFCVKDKNINSEKQSSISKKCSRTSPCLSTDHSITDSQQIVLSPQRYSKSSEANHQAQYQSCLHPIKSTHVCSVLKEPTQEITRPASRSREAAATAMLELKSAGQYRSSLSQSSIPEAIYSPSVKKYQQLPENKFPGTVAPLNSSRQHYKWSIGGQNYIVSAPGVQALETLSEMLETECPTESGRICLMHEFVKMKSLFEEKLDIEMRVRRDLQSELDHFRNSCKDKIQAANNSKKLLKQEMECMREEHAKRVDDLVRNHTPHKKNVLEGPSSCDVSSYDDLRSRIEDLEMKNDRLRINLLEEREKREKAENRCTAIDIKGRMSFLMESSLSRLMRDVADNPCDDDKIQDIVSHDSRKLQANEDEYCKAAQHPMVPISSSTHSTNFDVVESQRSAM